MAAIAAPARTRTEDSMILLPLPDPATAVSPWAILKGVAHCLLAVYCLVETVKHVCLT
jgi:hypothetical protein